MIDKIDSKTQKQCDNCDKYSISIENTGVKVCHTGCHTLVTLCHTVYNILKSGYCWEKNKITLCLKQIVCDNVCASVTGECDRLEALPILGFLFKKNSCHTVTLQNQVSRGISGFSRSII